MNRYAHTELRSKGDVGGVHLTKKINGELANHLDDKINWRCNHIYHAEMRRGEHPESRGNVNIV